MNDGELVWQSVLDGRYIITVVRTGPYCGMLRIEDADTDRMLREEEVLLAFDAILGPDVGDVAVWQETAIAVCGRRQASGRHVIVGITQDRTSAREIRCSRGIKK